MSADRVALAMPLTSRDDADEAATVARLREAAECLEPAAILFIGVDDDDKVLAAKDRGFFEDVLGRPCHLHAPFAAGTHLLTIYCELVEQAAAAGSCQYFVMWGDDIRCECPAWLSSVQARFQSYHDEHGVPYGFGCVALNDEANPGFPSYPVVHRTHLEIFGRFCPEEKGFVNQDADPWIFEVYRRCGCASFVRNRIRNTIGGAETPPRYKRAFCPCWKDGLLSESVAQVRAKVPGAPAVTILDVVTPSHRGNVDVLRGIASLRVPDGVDALFIFVVDNPLLPSATREELKDLERQFWPRVRVRFNRRNLGASGTRNRGIEESAAEWILFVDDDVRVEHDLLCQYARCIREDGDSAAGFVGRTYFPPPRCWMDHGVALSDITYFWDLACKRDSVPWGVTANIVLRRTSVRFGPDFPKTGGGEDVAFCLDTAALTRLALRPAPQAAAEHPWWDDNKVWGGVDPMRFYRWTQGDGLLLDMYPTHAYWSAPNVQEVWAAAAVYCAATPAAGSGLAFARFVLWAGAVELFDELVRLRLNKRVDLATREGWSRVLAAVLIKQCVEWGHLLVHLKPWRLRLQNVCRRFDWFCGGLTGSKQHPVRCAKFLAFVSYPLAVQLEVPFALCVPCCLAMPLVRWWLKQF